MVAAKKSGPPGGDLFTILHNNEPITTIRKIKSRCYDVQIQASRNPWKVPFSLFAATRPHHSRCWYTFDVKEYQQKLAKTPKSHVSRIPWITCQVLTFDEPTSQNQRWAEDTISEGERVPGAGSLPRTLVTGVDPVCRLRSHNPSRHRHTSVIRV